MSTLVVDILLWPDSSGLELAMMSLMAAFEPERVKDFVKTAPNGTSTFVDGSTFLPTLSKYEITHWQRTSEPVVATYVKRLIDVADRKDAAEVAAHYSSKSV